ncbi:MAG TPA: hypothetical protein VLX28_04745 [Thermoanaerobaculia bacterium]|nr:hypothetical protein [Thermoanaerobaculia bacterium]
MRKKLALLGLALAALVAAAASSPAPASATIPCPAANEHVVICPTGPICCPNDRMCDCP